MKEFLPDKSVCCIGSVWLEQCLKKEDIKLDEESAEIVLTGYDEHISMASLNHAIDLIMNGAIYISTNDDLWIPTGVAVKPHTGYINGMIYQATGKKPIIIGKPEQYFWKLIMQRTQAKTFCMIGDSMQTDAAFGLGNHMKVYLVKSRMADREREKDDLMIQKVKNLKEVIRYLST